MPDAAALYLDLLKRVLTGTVDTAEPDFERGTTDSRFMVDFLRHYIQGDAVTMLPRRRLDHLQQCIETALHDAVPGDLLEAGVWRGGATILMRAVLAAHGEPGRQVWVADSFEGLAAPDAARHPREARAYAGPVMRDALGRLAVGIDEVRHHFQRFGMLDDRVRFLPGWFQDTLPDAPIGPLAVLRIDCDFHDATLQVLEALYDRVSPAGFVIVDDYGEDAWTHCREAVDGFRQRRGITEPLVHVDAGCVCWRRAR
ncbi:TylF/MycF/NovP-related O-methyltransferase [Ramlibacter sp.]|uniref:TylF/MycF/NovP-related O-methyltransferase n=1 Tax=Ramlibacter sp. TaxID=1917967 RepID=UPI0035B42C11